MIKSRKLVYVIPVVILVITAGIAVWLYLPMKKCGIENCHGVNIICGQNVPELCTKEYQFGDRCRQYANCAIVNGECQLMQNDKFDECKSCVEKCLENPNTSYQCESECGK